MVLVKINNIDFTLVNKENLLSIVEGKYDAVFNSIALGDLGEDKELIEKAIPLIFIRNHGFKLNNLCLLGDFNQEISFFKTKDGGTLLPNMDDLYLMDGFNKKLISDPFTRIRRLYLYNIGEKVLEMESISAADTLNYIYLMEGFNQSILKGMIKRNVEKLYIGNIGDINKVFTVGSIPNSINHLIFMDGFNQTIFKDLIPPKTYIYLHNIGDQSLSLESIPKNTSCLHLMDGFNQTLYPGIIPPCVTHVYFSNIGPNVLVEGTITEGLQRITFCDGFNQPISKGMICGSVESIYIEKVGTSSLTIGSIPSTVKNVNFWVNFDLPILPGYIEEGVKWMRIYLKESMLQIGSIPSSVKTLYLSQTKVEILPGVIPNTVEKVEMVDFSHNVLKFGSLPNSLKELYLYPSLPQNPIVPGIIPHGVENLTIAGKLNLYVPPSEKPTTISKPSKYIYPLLSNIIPNTFTFLMTVFKLCLSLATNSNEKTSKKEKENEEKENEEMNPKDWVLSIGSIPNSVKILKLSHQFNHDLPIGMIPDSVEDLDLFEIHSKLEIGSFPNSIKRFRISNEYGLSLPKGMIPEGVEDLELCGETKSVPLSIPTTVTHLQLTHRFNYPLVKGMIPCGVKKMSLFNVGKGSLLEDSIPDSVKDVHLSLNSDKEFKHFFPSLNKD
ncbi:hypothetical protein ACTA71_002183 [Dictyostelium dimigraforme]